jgi:hypothetical protein
MVTDPSADPTSAYPGEVPTLLNKAAELAADHGAGVPALAEVLKLSPAQVRDLLGGRSAPGSPARQRRKLTRQSRELSSGVPQEADEAHAISQSLVARLGSATSRVVRRGPRQEGPCFA